jgi:hypothetical protein
MVGSSSETVTSFEIDLQNLLADLSEHNLCCLTAFDAEDFQPG